MSIRARERSVVAGAVVSLALLLAACGGDATPSASPLSESPGGAAEPVADGESPDSGGGIAPSAGPSREVPRLPDDFEPITVDVPLFVSPENYSAAGHRAFWDEVERLSEGKISAELHWSGAFMSILDAPTAASDGTIPFSYFLPAYLPATYPVETWSAELQWTTDAPSGIGGALAQAGARLEWAYQTEALHEEYASLNQVPLVPSSQATANYELFCDRPIDSLDTISGLSSRAPSPVHQGPLEALGFATTFISFAETYEAMQRGVLECTLSGLPEVAADGLIDVGEALMVDEDVTFPGFSDALVANADFWEELGPEGRQIIWHSLPAYLKGKRLAVIGANLETMAAADEVGVEIHQFGDDIRERMREYAESRTQDLAAEAPESVGADQAEALIESYQDIRSNWQATIEDLGYGDLPRWEDAGSEGVQADDIDLGPWIDHVWTNILEPRMPQ